MPARRFSIPIPSPLPGRFLLIVYSRMSEDYTLFVDDADKSSYKLGVDVSQASRLFIQHGLQNEIIRAMDCAREFGAAQLIFDERRCIPIKPPQKKPALFDSEEKPNGLLYI